MKIIHILHHSMSPYKMNKDIRYYEDDWHVRFAKEFLRRNDEFEIECWRPEFTFKEIYQRHKDGISYKIFPSYYLYPGGIFLFLC